MDIFLFRGRTSFIPAGKIAPFLPSPCTVPAPFIKIFCTARAPFLNTDVSDGVYMVFRMAEHSTSAPSKVTSSGRRASETIFHCTSSCTVCFGNFASFLHCSEGCYFACWFTPLHSHGMGCEELWFGVEKQP